MPTMVACPGWNAPGQQQAPGWAVLSPVGVGRQPWPWRVCHPGKQGAGVEDAGADIRAHAQGLHG